MKNTGWNRVAKSFHWAVALFIATAVALGLLAESADMSPGKLQLFIWHKSIGLTVLALMILRLGWRLLHSAPAAIPDLDERQRRRAGMGHTALYAIALILPLTGWLLNSAANFPFKWFGLFSVPMLLEPDKVVQSTAAQVHAALAWVLMALVAGHVFMAFRHQRAGVPVLPRMLPGGWGPALSIGMLVSSAAALVLLAWSSSYTATGENDQGTDLMHAQTPSTTQRDTLSEADIWVVIADQSSLGFTATYDDVAFQGRFEQFSPVIRFDSDSIERARFDVLVTTSSVTTDSADRDEMLPQEDWFNTSAFPQARYVASQFESLGPGKYRALGELELKGVTRAVPLEFMWQQKEGGAQLIGEAVVNRQDFGIGDGFWRDDPTIGFEVNVKTTLKLQRP